jgi:hypothetical protein
MLMRVAGHTRSACERMLRVGACVGIAAAALEGCMTLEQKPPPPIAAPAVAVEAPPRQLAVPPAVPKPVPRPVRKARHPAKPEPAARPERPPLDAKILVGMDQAGVRDALGRPKRVEAGRLSLSWFYDAPGCSMRVVFYPSLESGTFRALKFSSTDADGDPLDADNSCVGEILMARGNAH